jgi:type IV secretion system protein VirD4
MTTANIRKYVLPYLPYAAVFWFFSKVGEAYRTTPGYDVLKKMMGSMTTLNTVMAKPMPSFDPLDLLVGLTGAAIIFLVVYVKKKNAKNWRKDVEYGSARFGNKKDIEPFVDPKPDNNIILTATESLTLNGRPKNPKYARNKNVMVVGGSGSGKTRFWLKPNLMQCHSSYCITDPKGQILIECGKLLKRNKYEIKVLNTIDFSKSMR